MKRPSKWSLPGGLLALAGIAAADPIPQTQISFTMGSANTWNSDWTGVGQRTYFYQWSIDLVNWRYAPFIEFGSGVKSYGIHATEDGSGQPLPKVFVRLHYADHMGVSTLQQAKDADFDGDGVPNAYEVEQVGSDPFDRKSVGQDSDGDGLPDGWERFYFGSLTAAGPTAVRQPDGLTNKEKADLGLNPNVDYSSPTAPLPASYTYDLAGRLEGVTAPIGAGTYTPDEEGNILNAQ